jgi:hypothetical protein
MDAFDNNPFGLLTFLVAPAILTNASCVMLLSTSNRFGLAIDRVKAIVSDIENRHSDPGRQVDERLKHLKWAERRVLFLVRALTCLYLTVGSFVTASFVSLLGAVLFVAHQEMLRQLALIVSLCAGHGCWRAGGRLRAPDLGVATGAAPADGRNVIQGPALLPAIDRACPTAVNRLLIRARTSPRNSPTNS